jgi:spore coat protein U-like protein
MARFMHKSRAGDVRRRAVSNDRRGWRAAAAKLLAVTLLLSFCAAAQSQTCSFNGSGGGIAFAALDPSVATPQSAFTDLKVKCTPSGSTPTWQITGANGSAPFRMKHSVQNAFIPYSVSVAFINNTGVNQNWRLTASVLGSDYVNALAGSYSDTLTATVLP